MADYRSNIKDEVEVTPYRKIQNGSITGAMIKDRAITKNKLAEGVIPPINNLHIYSTEEKVVGKWIDGRLVYEKTIHIEYTQAITINTDDTVTLEENTNVDRVLFGNVATVGNNGSNNEANNNQFKVRKDVDNDVLIVQANSTYVGVSVIDVTVRYTKITDVTNA